MAANFSPPPAALETSSSFELVDRERYEALPPTLRFEAQVRVMDEMEALVSTHRAYNPVYPTNV